MRNPDARFKLIKKSLVPLALGGFGIGLTEFVVMGILPDIAGSLEISIPEAGYLISAYALGVVVGAPLLVGMFANGRPKSVLVWLMILFTVFNGLSAFSPGFHSLLLSRFLAGLPHGAFFGVGAVVASRLAEKGRVAAAVASMFSGLTLANVLGVPLGTYVGHNFSWRYTFVIVAAVGLLAILGLKKWVPDMEPGARSSFIKDLHIFRRPGFWLAMAITSIGTGGFFAWFSYIAPLLTDVSRFSPASLPLIMVVVGVGMTVGVMVGGKLADRFNPIKAIAILLSTMTILLCLNGLLAHVQPVMLALAFAVGANALALGPSIQMLLIEQSPGAEMLGSSLAHSGFNAGNAAGAFLGGVPLALGYSYVSPQWVAMGLAASGGVLALMMLAGLQLPNRKWKRIWPRSFSSNIDG